jgi:hypothetical protein
LFFIDRNNEKQTGACAPSASAVRETPGAARSPGSTLRLFLPVIYRWNGGSAFVQLRQLKQALSDKR